MAGRGDPLSDDVSEALYKLRLICRDLAPCEEASSYGNPAFMRGKKPFVILDRYRGQACLWLLIDPAVRDQQLLEAGWFPSPYDPRQLALCCALGSLDWTAAASLVVRAHDLAQI
jgi:hypothetical protein